MQKEGRAGALSLDISPVKFLLGADEAGRGPAAGGVFAACVSFFDEIDVKKFEKLNDSKKISQNTREKLYEAICENSYWAINCVEVEQIEKINILQSSLYAMKISAQEVMRKIGARNNEALLLVDGNKCINFEIRERTIIKGDFKSASIAAASVLAKVARDRYMDELDKKFPAYNFAKNKGYLTKEHIDAIKKHGICPYHRKSFLKNVLCECAV